MLTADISHPTNLFINLLEQSNIEHSIKNVRTEIDLIVVGDTPVPTTLNQAEYENSYVCSPYTAYISYSLEELDLITSKTQRAILKCIIKSADKLLKNAQINKTLSINNWLVSTNLLPPWSAQTLAQLTPKLIERYPNHSFNIRSLNELHHTELMASLKAQGWHLIPARQVYLFDNQARQWWKKSHTKRDQSLLRKTHLELVHPAEHIESDFEDIHRCFSQLFIEKHSKFNPQFTASFLYRMHLNNLLEFYSFRDPESQKIIASIGLMIQQDIITSPVVGYDTSLPQKLGLYRLLMAVLLKVTYESGKKMNLSSGASNFKRSRGGEPIIEYTAFYTKHLPINRRSSIALFAKALNFFGPKVLKDNQI